ncbi:MAG: DUF58 domain-containing protein [Acidimicrobiia bacterium]
MPLPLRRLAVALMLAAPIALAGWWAFAIANAAVMLVAGVDAVLAGSPKRYVVMRSLPRVMTLDGEAALEWNVATGEGTSSRGRGGRRVVQVADAMAPSLGAPTRRFSVRLASGDQARASTTLNPQRRGRFTIGPMTVRVHGPLHLMARQSTLTFTDELRVLPPFRSRAEAELRMHRVRLTEVGLRSARGRGGGTEFDQLREYTRDDEFRRIDWAATARSGRPVVRTYRAERNQTVLALLDSGRLMAGQVAGVPRIEWGMDALMMLTAVATHLGDRVGLGVFDRRVKMTLTSSSSRSQLARVSEVFADTHVALVESDLRAAVAEVVKRSHRRSLVVVCTELNPAAVDDVLLPGLVALRHHVVVVVSVRDPVLETWALQYGDPSDGAMSVDIAYRSAAAAATLEQRRLVAARLQGAGALVIDELPGRLATRLADTYLELKATGRL